MKKKTLYIIIIIAVIVLLVPIPMRLKDGGSVVFNSPFYKVTKYHQLDLSSISGYRDGWEIRIFGIEIYDSFQSIDNP